MNPTMGGGKTAISALVRVLGSIAARWGLGVGLVVLWQFLAMRAGSIFFPPPTEIAKRAVELWLSGPPSRLFLSDGVFQDILPSLFRLLAGWSLAVACGITLGTLIGRSRKISELLDPSLQFLRAIPGPALVPVFILLLGTESTMRITLIAFGSVWPVLLNTIEGTRTVDPVQLDTASAFRLPRRALLWRIVLPAATPKIFAGIRISLSLAVILMVVSELVASTNGIGYRIQNAQIMFLLTDMWCGIVLLAFVGYALNRLFLKIEGSALNWHRGARGRSAA
ncbi:MAG TPA: ABC transporter permease [Xanthobacteraceae bacterium]|jgi:ABC-type nitrate/sulfonate/bicarbonate transport system permease component